MNIKASGAILDRGLASQLTNHIQSLGMDTMASTCLIETSGPVVDMWACAPTLLT